MSPENPRAALVREAIRLHQRYQEELIERYSICPWAKPSRSDGHVRTHVVIDVPCSLDDLAEVVDGWAANEAAEVAFVITPRFESGSAAFDQWAEEVGALRSDIFLSAPFHPSPPEPVGIVRFLRQTPDPTVQLVRRSRLEEIRSQDPPHYTDIFDLNVRDLEASKAPRTIAASVLAHNDRLIDREGRAALQAIIDDIKRDRERTYTRIFPSL